MNQSQMKFLKRELQNVPRPNYWEAAEKKIPESSDMKAYRRMVTRFDAERRKERDRVENRFTKLRLEAERQILFGTEASARKAIKKLRDFKP